MALVTGSLEVESKFNGLVIGRGRTGLRKLEAMPGVVDVRFRTERRNPSPPYTTLTVVANSQEACQAVLNKVSLCNKYMKLAYYPKTKLDVIIGTLRYTFCEKRINL
jgi:hypothetical protein